MNKNRLFSKPVIVAALLILIAISCASIAAAYLFSLIQTDVKSRLSDTLEASISRAKNDIQTHKRNARYWSENLSLRQIMQIIEAGGSESVEDDLYRRLDTTLTAITESEHYRDYKLFNLNGELLLSGRDGVEDSPRSFNLPSSLLREARSGEVAVSQPLKSQQLWQDMDGHIREGLATMLFMAPVIDWFGETVGFFAFEMNPDRLFIPAFHENQVGSTGQT